MLKTIKLKDKINNEQLNILIQNFNSVFIKYNRYLLNNKYIYGYGTRKSFDVIFKMKDFMHLIGIYSYTNRSDKCSQVKFGSLDFYKDLLDNKLNIAKINIRDTYRALNLIYKKIDALNKSIIKLKSKNSLKLTDSCIINKKNYDNLIIGKYENYLLLCVKNSQPKSSRNIKTDKDIDKIAHISTFRCKYINIIPLN